MKQGKQSSELELLAAVRSLHEPAALGGPEPDWEAMARTIDRAIATAAEMEAEAKTGADASPSPSPAAAAARRRARPSWLWPSLALTGAAAAALLLLWWRGGSEPPEQAATAPITAPSRAPSATEPPGDAADREPLELPPDALIGGFLDEEKESLGSDAIIDWPEVQALEVASDEELEAVLQALNAFPG